MSQGSEADGSEHEHLHRQAQKKRTYLTKALRRVKKVKTWPWCAAIKRE
jgi:hypothetical protein